MVPESPQAKQKQFLQLKMSQVCDQIPEWFPVRSPPDGPKLPSVSVSPSGEIVEGSSVTLTCSSDANPAASYSWYREGEDTPQASDKIFTISDVSLEHSGNYSCVAQNTCTSVCNRANSVLKSSASF
uniref:Ig-like domain-containing protein n=1 Tax=Salarias fasciatus TaxID=181472 RepID=A0A672G461_SALFA